MEIRCHHCGKLFALPAQHTGPEARCPACGVMSLLRREPVHPLEPPTANMRPHLPSNRAMRRIFDPIPRPVAYSIGAIIVVAILAPFWLVLINDQPSERPPVISQDADDLPVPPPAPETNSSLLSPTTTGIARPPAQFDRYQGVRLDAPRDALDRRFVLYLKNTRGMTPEIYESLPGPDVHRLTASFYQNALKEFVLVFPARKVTAEEVLQKLRQELGEPREWGDARGVPHGSFGAAIAGGGDEWERYPYRRHYSWFDEESRLDATLHFTTPDPQDCVAVLVVRVTATRWLAAHQPGLSSAEAATNRMPAATETPDPDQPRRLFP